MKVSTLKKRSSNVVTIGVTSPNALTSNLIKSVNALSSDLSIIIDEINNKIGPALNGAASSTDDSISTTEDAFVDGLMGKNIFVDRSATSSSSSWLYSNGKPTTVKEALSLLNDSLLSKLALLENTNEVVSDYTKDYIGLKAFDSADTSAVDSIDGRLGIVEEAINTDLPTTIKSAGNGNVLFADGTKNPADSSDFSWDSVNGLTVGKDITFSGLLKSTGGDTRGTASVDFQITRAGTFQVASGNYSGILSGQNNKAVGIGSHVTGGYQNSSITDYSRAAGRQAVSTFYGEDVWSSGANVTDGDAQVGRFTMKVVSNSNVWNSLTLNAAIFIAIEDHSTYMFDCVIVGRRPSDDHVYSYGIKFVVNRNAGAATVTIPFSNKSVLFETDAGADAQVLADTLNGGFNLQVLPPSNTVTNWVADVKYTKVI